MAVKGGPFGEAAPEDAACLLGFGFARGFSGDCAVMECHFVSGVIGDTEDEETEVDEDGEDRLAGELHAAAPAAGAAEGATDFAIDFHPLRSGDFVPEAFHFPRKHAHVGWASDGDTIAPDKVLCRCLVDVAEAHIGFGDLQGTVADEFSHFRDVAGVGVKKDEDAVG